MVDNRIAEGGAIPLGTAPTAGNTPPAENNAPVVLDSSGFPEVDMTYLNGRVVEYLKSLVPVPTESLRNEDEVTPVNKIEDPTVAIMIEALGSSFIKLSNIHPIDGQTHSALQADINLDTKISVPVLKKGIEQLLGADYVSYFLEEIGSTLGITDETSEVDLTDQDLIGFLPGIGPINNIAGSYLINKDPYLLLLAAEAEDRPYLTFFFDKARENKWDLFTETGIVRANRHVTQRGKKAWTYALEIREPPLLAAEKMVIPFQHVITIGKDHDIKGLMPYLRKLEQFGDLIREIK